MTMRKTTKLGRTATRPARWGLFTVTPIEMILCVVVIAGCVGLHFPAIHQHFAWAIEIGLSLLSFATPISGMLYLSAAQVIPDPVIQPLITSSMMAVAGFFIWRLRGSSSGMMNSSLPLLKAVAPYFLWCSAMTLLRGDSYFFKRMAYAIITGCVAAALVRQSRNRLMTCLLAFLVGQAIAATVFWMIKLSLGTPVQTFDTDVYGESTAEALRFGTARGNATALGPSMALVAIGVLAHWLIFPAERSMRGWLVRIVGLGLFVVVVPPLIGSGCRGAMVAVVCSVMFLFFGGLVSKQAMLAAPIVLVAGALVIALFWSQLGLDKSWEFTVHRQEVDTTEGGSVVAGRQNEWKAAALGVLDSPIVGGGHIELLSYQDNPEMWASHNTYLDGGLVGGLPGMALFIWFVVKPLVGLWHRRRDFIIGCFLSIYLMNAIVIATTSAAQVKDLWILWGVAAAWFVPSLAARQGERKRWSMKFREAFRAGSGACVNAPAAKAPHAP
jgi:O-Antigen ligase